MRLLLGSGGMGTPERRDPWIAAKTAFLGSIERYLFIPWASKHHDRYVEWMREMADGRWRVDSIHEMDDPIKAVEEADAISVGGGNTFLLVKSMQDAGILQPIRERVLHGAPYIGVSAGTNVASPTMRTTNDMPIVTPNTLDTLGLISFQINPHYFAGKTFIEAPDGYVAYGGETRDDRIREYHEHNDLPVLGLWEGSWLHVEGDSATLGGAAARLFRRDEEAVDYAPGTSVDFLLGAPTL